MRLSKSSIRVLSISLVVILLGQVAKYVVFQTMNRGQSIPIIGDWLRLTFTENPGMAFGIEYGPPGTILVLSVIATVLIVIYMKKIGHIYGPYLTSLAFIFGGAVSNIIDRIFNDWLLYGGDLFHGKVVDFIHVNVWRGYVPDSIPFLGGKYVALFPIWNVADMAIVAGVIGILLFQRQFHENASLLQEEEEADTAAVADPSFDSSIEESGTSAKTLAEPPG
jgi:signal peptidase II